MLRGAPTQGPASSGGGTPAMESPRVASLLDRCRHVLVLAPGQDAGLRVEGRLGAAGRQDGADLGVERVRADRDLVEMPPRKRLVLEADLPVDLGDRAVAPLAAGEFFHRAKDLAV